MLTEPGHAGATYELVGADALSQTEVAEVLTAGLGRTIHARSVPRDEWERGARASGLADYQVETLVKMFQYYERYGFWGGSRVLSWLLNRPPTSFEFFIERTVRERLEVQ